MQRVMIVGSPGAGKSTFSRALAARTGLPLVHLDKEHWQPGWVEPPPELWRARQAELVAGERWIIDGNYGATVAIRLARADTVMLLDYPTPLCLWWTLRRIVAGHLGAVRADLAPGCPERLDLEFLRYIALFRRRKTPRLKARLNDFPGTVVCFRRPREAAEWLSRLDDNASEVVGTAYNPLAR